MFARRSQTFFLWLLPCVLTGLSTSARAQAPMQAQAQRAAQRPLKLDIRPLARAVRLGDQASVEVTLLDASNQPSKWSRPCRVEVVVTGPSGHAQAFSVTVPANQSSTRFTFAATEPGLLILKAQEANGSLLPGGNSMYVRRGVASHRNSSARSETGQFAATGTALHFLTVAAHSKGRLIFPVALPVAAQDSTGAQGAGTSSSPELLLVNSSGKDEILADGRDFARLQVYYMDPRGGSAPADVKVWLTWSSGRLGPQPLVIKRGEIFAEAEWTSLSPVDASASLVASAPQYPVGGKRDLTVSFVPAIYGIAVPGPNPLKLSLIDCEPVFAQFFDQDGRAVQTNKARQVTFISSNPSLHLDPSSENVPANGFGASIFLVPTWSGTSKLDIWTPGYDHETLVVQVAVGLVLVLCLAGGIVGGIAAWDALKGSIVWRIFAGILGAIVLVWISVYAVLPKTHSIIAHNLVSVFVLSIVGGFSGTRVLDFAGKKFGCL